MTPHITKILEEVERLLEELENINFNQGFNSANGQDNLNSPIYAYRKKEELTTLLFQALTSAITAERERCEKIVMDENYVLEEWYISSLRPDTITHFDANQRNMATRTRIQEAISNLK